MRTHAALRPAPYGTSAGSAGRQTSAAREQRGANGQPGGRFRRSRWVARQPGRREAGGGVADARERRRQGCGVRVQRRREDLVGGPTSTTRPAYITVIRSQRFGEHRQVVADHQHARRRARATRSAAASSTCACTITSSAVVGSSATTSSRVAGQRHRDHHPLLLATGELVRIGRWRAPGRGRPAPAARRPAGRTAPFVELRLVHADRLGDLARRSGAPGSASATLPGTRSTRPPSAPPAARPTASSARRVPSKCTSPVTVAFAGCSRRTVLASVDLPQPDSPATPTICRARRSGRRRAPPAAGPHRSRR